MSLELSTLGSVIKVAYEAEDDTNAFTDAYKALLDAGNASVEYFETVVMNSAADEGIKIGNSEASGYGWRDITGQVRQRGSGANDPSWSVISSSAFSAWKFGLNDEIWIEYHIPHDYVPGTAVHFHAHWLSDGSDVANTVKWEWEICHSPGFGQAAFNLATSVTATAEQASAGQHYHMVTETAAVTLANLEVDAMIYVRCRRVANGATDNTDGIFLITTDVHYQSHNLATKNKAPNFYT